MITFIKRIVGAANLEIRAYKEIEADTSATAQAVAIVVLVSIAEGIGALVLGGSRGFVVGTVTALIGWFGGFITVYLVGTQLLAEPQTRSEIDELLRTTGFSAAPGLLRVLASVPGLRTLIMVGVNIWMFLAMVIAVRQSLSYQGLERAVGVCLIGWFVQIGIMVFLTVYVRPLL